MAGSWTSREFITADKIEMMRDQKFNRALVVGRHLNALHRRLRQLNGQARVVAVVGAFAGVMKQQREPKQGQVLDLGENFG